jgi:hypothetical protein
MGTSLAALFDDIQQAVVPAHDVHSALYARFYQQDPVEDMPGEGGGERWRG